MLGVIDIAFAFSSVGAVVLLGHSNIGTTMRYAHSNDEAKRRAAQRLKSNDKTVPIVPRKAKIAV